MSYGAENDTKWCLGHYYTILYYNIWLVYIYFFNYMFLFFLVSRILTKPIEFEKKIRKNKGCT